MELNVTVNPKSVHDTVNKIIGERVEQVIQNELGSFVEGYLAKKKLTGKSPPDMVALIDRRLNTIVQSEVKRRIHSYIGPAVEQAIQETIRKTVEARLKTVAHDAQIELRAVARESRLKLLARVADGS